MTANKWIRRRELAEMAGLSVDVIRRNEKALGLTPLKVVLGHHKIVYDREAALAALVARRLIKPGAAGD
jgi:hypothetical protein